MDASTRSSSSGTSMSMSSNSKLKAALTWAGHTRPAVALFSRPSRLSSSRSVRVILIRRWQPAMAHLTGTLLGISLILQRQLREGVSRTRARCAASTEPGTEPGAPSHHQGLRHGGTGHRPRCPEKEMAASKTGPKGFTYFVPGHLARMRGDANNFPPCARECRQFKNIGLQASVSVIPAKAGTRNPVAGKYAFAANGLWIPAFAGMTVNMTTLPRANRQLGEI